jgi:hypothetical protein
MRELNITLQKKTHTQINLIYLHYTKISMKVYNVVFHALHYSSDVESFSSIELAELYGCKELLSYINECYKHDNVHNFDNQTDVKERHLQYFNVVEKNDYDIKLLKPVDYVVKPEYEHDYIVLCKLLKSYQKITKKYLFECEITETIVFDTREDTLFLMKNGYRKTKMEIEKRERDLLAKSMKLKLRGAICNHY